MKSNVLDRSSLLFMHFGFFMVLGIMIPLIHLFYSIETKEYMVMTIGIWGIVSVFSRGYSPSILLDRTDIILGLFVVYMGVHFALFSINSVWYMEVWWRLSLVVFYYILRNLYAKYLGQVFQLMLIFIVSKYVVEVLVGVLQLFGVLPSRNPYFELAGTFATPNFYAASLCLGLLSTFWSFLYVPAVRKQKSCQILAIFLSILGLFLVFKTYSRSAVLALFLGLIVLGYTSSSIRNQVQQISRFWKVVIVVSCTVGLLFSGNYMYYFKKDSADGRAFIAKIMWQEIQKKPMLGHGVFSFTEGYNTAKSHYFTQEERSWSEIKNGNYIYSAFNEYLELSYEAGGIALLLFLILIAMVFRRKTMDSKRQLGAAIVVFFLVMAIFFSISRNATLSLMVVIAFFIVHSYSTANGKYTVKNRDFMIAVSLMSTMLLAIYGIKVKARRDFNQKYHSVATSNAIPRAACKRMATLFSDDGYSDFYYGKMVYENYDLKEGLAIMEGGIKKNMAPKLIRKLIKYYKKQGCLERAEALCRFNIGNEFFRFQHRGDLIAILQKTGDTIALKILLHNIINFPVKIPSKKVEDYKKQAGLLLEKITASQGE